MKLSLIIPLFNEEGNIERLYKEIKVGLSNYKDDYEIIFINDGSTDKTLDILIVIASADKRVKVLNLSKNYGQSAAFQAGFDNCSNEIVVTMDGDLQNDPADILKLIEHLEKTKSDAVIGWRRKRHDPSSKTIPSFIANKMISMFLNLRVHDTGCSFKAFRSDILKEVRLYGEMHRFIPYLINAKGFSISEIEVNHRRRFKEKSKYGIGRVVKVILDMLTVKFLNEFSTNPIYVMGGLSFFSFILSVLSFIALFVMKIAMNVDMTGNPLLIISVFLFMISLQMLMLGLISEIQVRIYFETVKKDIYKIRDSINVDKG
jgi:glycosyltransferase involved in cell wall biosynthesis